MKIKTNELTGGALDWAVAKCEVEKLQDAVVVIVDGSNRIRLFKGASHNRPPCEAMYSPPFTPTTDWAQGGMIIEREEIGIRRRDPCFCFKGEEWEARVTNPAKRAGYRWAKGPTPLISAMRCYVASKLGDEVEVPDGVK